MTGLAVSKRDQTFPLYRSVRSSSADTFTMEAGGGLSDEVSGVPKFLVSGLLDRVKVDWPHGLVLRPPFPELWVECSAEDRLGRGGRFGAYVTSGAGGGPAFESDVENSIYVNGLILWRNPPETAGLAVTALPSFILPLSRDWSLLGDPKETARVAYDSRYLGIRDHPSLWGDVCDTVLEYCSGIARFFGMLNCANVATEEVVFRPSVALRRAEGMRDYAVRYHVLKIKGSARSPADEREGDHGVALHVCRGHFKRYSASRPHVSGFVGQMWVRAHVRGDREKGVSLHDYQSQKRELAGPGEATP